MAAAELELIAALLNVGDLAPIHSGAFRVEHCLTNEGKALHHFLSSYKYVTEGAGRVPTRNVILERFDTLAHDLPEITATPDVGALLHEVHIASMRSKLSDFALEIAETANAVDPMGEIVTIRRKLDQITAEISPDRYYGFDTHLDEVLENYATGMILPYGIPWFWPGLQDATRGMQRGEFIILSGRPKTRKTFVALKALVHAFLLGYRILVFTPEMHPMQILLRAAAMAANLRYDPFKKGQLNHDELEALIELVEEYGNPRFAMDQEGEFQAEYGDDRAQARAMFRILKATNRPVSYIENKIEEMKPDVVFVDSFYRLAGDNSRKSDSDHKVMTSISRDLKDMASEHEVVVLGTHQINREGSKKVGSLDNLAYADAFGQDADMVLRVITNKREDEPDLSALVVLGGRETTIDGVLIHNEPCSDFDEIGIITDLKKVMAMLQQEEADQEGDEPADDAEEAKQQKRNQRFSSSLKRLKRKKAAAAPKDGWLKNAAKRQRDSEDE